MKKSRKLFAFLVAFAMIFALIPGMAFAAEENKADEFDKTALYTIINGWGSGYTLGYPGLNNEGDIFPIGVKTTDSDGIEKKYDSFCAHAGSETFAGSIGCSGYLVEPDPSYIESVDYANFLSAFNYIEDKYGSVADNRALTQVIIWALLGTIDVDSDEFDAIEAWKVDKTAARDVMANYSGYVGDQKIKELVYLTCEAHGLTQEGMKHCQPQLVPLYGEEPIVPQGSLKIIKTVDGLAFNIWAQDYEGDIGALLSGISFEIYKVGNEGDDISTGVKIESIGKLDDTTGLIAFDNLNLDEGWYAVVEKLEGKAAEVFYNAGVQYFYITKGDGNTYNVQGTGTDFDKTAQYYTTWSWGSSFGSYILETTFKNGKVWSFVNDDNNPNAVLRIDVKTSLDDDAKGYLAFCASHGSLTFGENIPYEVKEDMPSATRDNLRKAYNYIYDMYGSISGWQESLGNGYTRPITAEGSTYAIAQAVTWLIIHENKIESIDVISNNHGFQPRLRYDGKCVNDINDCTLHSNDCDAYVCLNDAIADVMANYKTFQSKGAITEVVFLANAEYPDNPARIQPQVVPIFGGNGFDNREIVKKGELIITKNVGTYQNHKGSITGGYSTEGSLARDKQPHNLDVALGTSGNWFQYNQIQLSAAKNSWTFDLVQGDKLNKVGEYTISYNPATKKFTVTFNDGMATSGVKLSISNAFEKNVKNKNSVKVLNSIWTSAPGQQTFSFSGSKYEFGAPAGLDVNKPMYVYLHLDGLSGYVFEGYKTGDLEYLVTGPNDYKETVFVKLGLGSNGLTGTSEKLEGLAPGEYIVKEVNSGKTLKQEVGPGGTISFNF